MLKKYETSSNEIITLYAAVSPATISAVTDKIWPLVETWQNRRLERVYPIMFLDAISTAYRVSRCPANT